ncbi:hypothetical protein EDD85DRAFT_946156 [Armillaria nabsnona]|nr:hypothetical protein EDD85DRAFT_946156 [Armillaria nabsnona]
MSSEICVIPSVSGLDVLEPDDPVLKVMQDHLMEERLIKLKVYKNMPLLRLFHGVVPGGLDPDTYDAPTYFTFDDIVRLYKISLLGSLVEFFNFGVYGAYVNPAHTPPGTMTLMNRKASIVNETAVCLMSGVMTECLLFDAAVLGT